jgi:hypothetical protein
MQEHEKGEQAEVIYTDGRTEWLIRISDVKYMEYGIKIKYQPLSGLETHDCISTLFIPYHSLKNIDFIRYTIYESK